MSDLVPRAVCYRCFKPQAMCLCGRVPRVDNRTTVFVLQHPRERLHPIGTARLADLGLRNARIEVAWNAGVVEEEPPSWLPERTALLFPSPEAPDLAELPEHERPRQLLVLDGTWATAGGLYRDKRWLQRMPHVRLSPAAPSRYRLRREPYADYISTIEAIVEALRLLEPETTGLDQLLGAFDAMIDDQLVHVLARSGPRRERRRRPEALRRLPEAIVSAFPNIMLAYTETARDGEGRERELVQLCVHLIGSGASFERFIAPRAGVPSQLMLDYMELQASDYAHAIGLAELRAQWSQWLALAGPAPIVAAWNQSTLDALEQVGLPVPSPLLFKSAYRGRCGKQHATLHDAVAAHALSLEPNLFRGRAAERMASALAIARHLHALGNERE